jgi:mono/diheme cytochrome c family protein
MTPGLRIFLLVLVACAAALTLGIDSATRAQESYSCPSGKSSCYQSGYAGLTEEQEHGRDTWYFWTGGDLDSSGKQAVGDQALWRILAIQSHGTFDLLQAIDSRYRGQRFKLFGVISDPDCKKATGPDQYGLWLDDCSSPDVPKLPDVPGEPTGVMGLRKFRNPNFNPAAWDVNKYMADPATVEPPYLIGMACGFCHVGFNPLHPPADPENPEWHNLHPGMGNQYFKEQLFNTSKFPASRGLKTNDFRWQVANAQPQGTSETSQVATDHINNPNVINNIANLNFRPKHTERTADGVERDVYHVLKDGADSIGSACLDDPTPRPGVDDTACAALRVYVNIGLCAAFWTTLHDPVYGLKRQQGVFDPKQARKDSSTCNEGWLATQARMNGLEAFLRTLPPLHLADADGGAAYLPKDPQVVARGKIVFAENCARCHSSERPPKDYQGDATEWYRKAVVQDDFLTDNFLSDDERHPVSEIGTNSERAMASNAIEGHIWQDFSSETYKKLPDVHIDDLVNPLNTDLKLLPFEGKGGRGYYRTPTLAGMWATAPYFHNNSLGIVTNDPSIQGRLTAYQDAMEKLLWPDRRLGIKTIRKTTQASSFKYEEGGSVCVAKNTPIDLIANVDLVTPDNFRTNNFFTRWLCHISGTGHLNELFLLVDNAPDFVQDRGHTFGSKLPDEDKRALIEYMKLF